jgi:hypothetical protein
MEVDYDIGPQDMVDFNWHIYSSPARRKQRMMKVITVTSLIALPGLILLDAGDHLGPMLLCAAAVFCALSLVLTPILIRRQIAQHFPPEKNSAIYGWRRMTIDSERIMQQGELIVAGYKWAAVERIEISDRQVLFFIAQSAALVIPRRAFRDETALRSFVEEAQRFNRAARPAAP